MTTELGTLLLYGRRPREYMSRRKKSVWRNYTVSNSRVVRTELSLRYPYDKGAWKVGLRNPSNTGISLCCCPAHYGVVVLAASLL
jgi:hypothetical protein